MTIEHSFNIIRNANLDPITGLFFELQNALDIFTYGLIFFFIGVSYYVYNKRLNDTGKAAIMSIHIGMLLTTIMYYWGISGNYFVLTGKMFVSEYFLVPYIILYILVLISLKFYRSSPV